MTLSRARALGLIGAAALLPSCGGASGAIRVASKNFTEAILLAEIYAQTLEANGLAVDRKFNLGSTQIVLAAMQRGEVDLYPEYTGTALIDVLHHAPIRDADALYATVREAFAKRFDIAVLAAAPMDDSQALATTRAIAQRYRIATLSRLATIAPRLRLATIPEFLKRADGLPGLQKFYGGFRFADVATYDIGLKYDALLQGKADVATAFSTDGAIVEHDLVLLEDDRHFWPAYNPAPFVRRATLAKHPAIAGLLNAVSATITDADARRMNASVENGKRDPADVAAEFLKAHGR